MPGNMADELRQGSFVGRKVVRNLLKRAEVNAGKKGGALMNMQKLPVGIDNFPGLNNLMIHSISDANFDEYFGFTEAEVQNLLADYGLTSHAKEIREWYDGYRFGGQDVYCPWDVISYCYALRTSEEVSPKAYWRNTSGNDMVRRLISKGRDGTTQMEDEQLLDTVSFYDAQESFYHGFLLALLSTCADWWVSSNEETGKGRSDIIVQRKDRTNGFVVEVKDVKDENKLEAACQHAMQQIAKKDYYTALLRRYRLKEIRAYGIAFWDKECRVVMERIV